MLYLQIFNNFILFKKIYITSFKLKIKKLPCQAYVEDQLSSLFTFFITIIINVAFLFTILVNINKIIDEKNTKMKEYLKLIGIKWYTIWLSWFLRILLVYITMSLLLAILGSIKLSTDFKDEFGKAISKALFLRTDFITIFVTFVVYSIQSAAFIVLVSQFFKKRKISKFFN
jgi:ATP-binding cassette subfamily A (ABC1) protein 3